MILRNKASASSPDTKKKIKGNPYKTQFDLCHCRLRREIETGTHKIKSTRQLYFRERDYCNSLMGRRARPRRSLREQGPGTRTRAAPTRSYERVKQLAHNLHMQPQSLHWGEPSTIMRFYEVSFEGTDKRADSGRLRDFSHNAGVRVRGREGTEKAEKSIVATQRTTIVFYATEAKAFTKINY